MKEVTGRGFIAGLFVWLLATWGTAQEMACLDSSCEAGDLMVFAVISVGFLAPAWLVADLASALLKELKAISAMRTAVSEWFGSYGIFFVVALLIIIIIWN